MIRPKRNEAVNVAKRTADIAWFIIQHGYKLVAVVGSRRRNCKEYVEELINSLPLDVTIVSGGCRGVDTWAEVAARRRGMSVLICRPNMRGVKTYYDRVKRYYARNKRVAERSHVVVAFVSEDRTGGTENTLKYAEELGHPCFIC